jgi:hypothetical protein
MQHNGCHITMERHGSEPIHRNECLVVVRCLEGFGNKGRCLGYVNNNILDFCYYLKECLNVYLQTQATTGSIF